MLLRTEGIRPAMRRLRKRLPFYFSPDMDLGPRDAVFVEFFGIQASTVTALHRLATLTDAKVMSCITRLTDKGYTLSLSPLWENFPSADEKADTRRMNAFIEQEILKQPADYFWSHRRFKTRPPGEPSLY
jgi:Kdo2-lipid IVA lauroyltransferase/acyltransferase